MEALFSNDTAYQPIHYINPISQLLNHTIPSSILVRAVNETSTQYFVKLFHG